MTEPLPLVSIVLPTFNGCRFLKEALQSCLSQDYCNLEVIVVLDASTDDSEQIIDSCKDQRIKKIKNAANQGLARSLNIGFRQARGEYLTWTSDDNLYEPQAISSMAGWLEKNLSCDFVYANYNVIDDSGRVLRAGKVRPPSSLDADNYVGGCFLYRRRVYEKLGDFNPEAFLAEDYEYWLRVRQSFKMQTIEPALYRYRLHDESLTGKYREEKVQVQVRKIRERFIPRFKALYFQARDDYQAKNLGDAKQHVSESILANPFFGPALRLWFLINLNPSVVAFIRRYVLRRSQKEA